MKRFSFLLLFLLPYLLSCQQGDENKHLTEEEKLVAIAKVWGFLKYYHPEVAKGKFNWDQQLFGILKKVEKVETAEDLSTTLTMWIDQLGEIIKCNTCLKVTIEEKFDKNFDLSWIDSFPFNKELSEKLRFIEKNRVQGEQYYITTGKRAGNILVQNEQKYHDFNWDNKDLRLLALFRYWNQVEYFFPYKYQMDTDWDKVLNEILPTFLNPKDETAYHLGMLELTAHVDDSHAWFFTPVTNNYFGYYWAPVKIKMIDKMPVVAEFFDSDLAEKDDWQLGDILTAVNGVSIKEILGEKEKYMTGSNIPAKYRDVHIKLLNGSTPFVEIEFKRNNELHKKKVSRHLKKEFEIETYSGPTWEILKNNIGYVHMGMLKGDDVNKMMTDLKNTKAIIFDIRNYPNGTLYKIAKEINSKSQPFVKFTIPDLHYPGKFTWTQPLKAGIENKNPYQGEIILLVNETTQSHAEFTTMALQTAPKVKIIGSQTAGADGNISDISYVGGFRTYISGIGVYYPDGRETQRTGIVPDIEIKPSIQGIREGKDEVLEKALEVLM